MTKVASVLEFQHSHLRREERESRESFYQNMMWIVDGLRRVRDHSNFLSLLREARVINLNPVTVSVANTGALLRDWSGSRVAVFFDFGDIFPADHPLPFDAPVLWRLNPGSPEGEAQLSPVPKKRFVESALNGTDLYGIDCSALGKHMAAVSQGRTSVELPGDRVARPRRRL